jgi:hypothetical protein
MGAGMCAAIDCDIYSDIADAARAAHSKAEYDAERERDYQAAERERLEQEEREAEQAEIDECDAETTD